MTATVQSRTHELSKITCPECSARLTVDPTALRGQLQCPKCLNIIEPAGPQSKRPSDTDTDNLASLRERIARLEHEREQRLALQSDLEIISNENNALKATLEGFQTEKEKMLKRSAEQAEQLAKLAAAPTGKKPPGDQPPPAPASVPNARLDALTSERDDLAHRLASAEAALADAARIIESFQDLESRIDDVGARYLQARQQLEDLERSDHKKR